MVERVKSRKNGNDHEEALADALVSSLVQPPKMTVDEVVSVMADAFTKDWQAMVAGIIASGTNLTRWKAELRKRFGRGHWGKLVKRLPISHRTANCLMRIADHPVLSDSQFIANLPPSWGTLYDLATIEPEEAVADLIAAKKIHAGMTRDDAAEVIRKHREAGDYRFEQIVEALAVLKKFEVRWPDPDKITESVFDTIVDESVEIDVDTQDARRIVSWLAQMVEGFGPLQEVWDHWPEQDEDDPSPPPPKRSLPPFSAERTRSKRDDQRSLDDGDADPIEPTPEGFAAFAQDGDDEDNAVCAGEQEANAGEQETNNA